MVTGTFLKIAKLNFSNHDNILYVKKHLATFKNNFNIHKD